MCTLKYETGLILALAAIKVRKKDMGGKSGKEKSLPEKTSLAVWMERRSGIKKSETS